MFERETRQAADVMHRGDRSDIFLFIGSNLAFPNSILRLAEQEAGAVHGLRLDSLREIRGLARDPRLALRKVFFDDRVSPEVLRDFSLLRGELPGADWILTYRDAATARHLLELRQKTPQLMPILLLPMNLPICPWTSMLRLVLGGQFIASGDLFGPATAPLPDHEAPAPLGAEVEDTRAASDPGLTRREKEVLALVSQGGRNKTIAHAMSVSEHTVKLHLHNAITKIGVRNRTEAATWYLSRQMGEGS